LDGLADVVGELPHALEELGAAPVAFRAIVGLDLEQRDTVAFVWRTVLPP